MRFRVPAAPRRIVAQAERARQVDDADAGVDERRRKLGRFRIGEREEDEIGVLLQRVLRQRHDGAVPHARERREAARGGGGLARRHRGGERDGRVAREQPQQLLAGVAGGAGDGDARRRASGARRHLPVGGDCMHRKEYLYRQTAVRSTEIDVYSVLVPA